MDNTREVLEADLERMLDAIENAKDALGIEYRLSAFVDGEEVAFVKDIEIDVVTSYRSQDYIVEKLDRHILDVVKEEADDARADYL